MAKEENYQGFIVGDHPAGDLQIQVYADKVVVKCGMMMCTVPLNHASLNKLVMLEEECATLTAH